MKNVLVKKISLVLLVGASIFTITTVSAAYLDEVEATDFSFTGNPRGYCTHGGYLVQNCVPGRTSCYYMPPAEP